MRKILLTGGSGLVGRNIAEKLGGTCELLAPARRELDLSSYTDVLNFLERHVPDLVIHCAGVVGGIQANMEAPVDFLSANTNMGMNLINASAEAGIPRLLNMASSCMYPRAARNPLRETSILTGELEPTNEGYALAKILCARLCQYHSHGNPRLRYRTLIPCNLYGRHDRFDPRKSHMIPAVIRRLHEAKLSGATTVPIWGTGRARREFMYAGEFADFVASAISRFDELPELMNVGIGRDYSVAEYYRRIAEVVGFAGRFTYDRSKPEGMKRKLLDISRLRAFGWQSTMCLTDGIRRSYEFYLETEQRA